MKSTTDTSPPALDARQALSRPYPARGAVEVLSDRVCHLLSHAGYTVGDRFLTDDELVELTGLSRSTVRRALAALRQRGWLQSRAGMGTYVGRIDGERPRSSHVKTPVGRQAIRMGVLAFNGKMPDHDWYTPQVMRGVSEASADHNVRVEMLTGLTGPLSESVVKLESVAPDVVISLSADPNDGPLLRLASEGGMRCLLAGTTFPELDLPRVCEDNRGGMDMVVRKLAERGHERIGLIMRRWVGSWLFKRHEQWHNTLRRLGLAHDEQLMHWLPMQDAELVAPQAFTDVADWFERARPTAIICGHYAPALHLGHLIREGRLRVPEQASVAVIDLHPEVPRMLGMPPASAALPLREIGRKVVELASAWCDGQAPASLTRLPLTWIEGPTLADHKPEGR